MAQLELDFKHNGERLLHLIRQRYPDYHPIVAIADIAHSTDDPNVALRAHTTILNYTEPSLQSIQVSHELKKTRVIEVKMFEEAITDETSPQVPSVSKQLSIIDIMPDGD